MIHAQKVLTSFLDTIFHDIRHRKGDQGGQGDQGGHGHSQDSEETGTPSVPSWLTSISSSFVRNSEEFETSWSSGRLSLFVTGARHITDRECCEFIGRKDKEVDSVPVKYRRDFLSDELDNIDLGLYLTVSDNKIEALKQLCYAELRVMDSLCGEDAARHRIEAFFWSTLFILNDNALTYGLSNIAWMHYIIAMCIAFMIIDDSIDFNEDRSSGSNTMFTLLPAAESVQLGKDLLVAVSQMAFFHDDTYLPFVALNSLTRQTLKDNEAVLIDENGVKNVTLACALGAAYAEITQTTQSDSEPPTKKKRIFDASVFMHELGKPLASNSQFCVIS